MKIKYLTECKQSLEKGINSPRMQRASCRNQHYKVQDGAFVEGDYKDIIKRVPADLMQTDNHTITWKQRDKLLTPAK